MQHVMYVFIVGGGALVGDTLHIFVGDDDDDDGIGRG